MKLGLLLFTGITFTIFSLFSNAQQPEEKGELFAQTIVYVTKTGSKYHTSSCHYLKHSKYSKTLSEAKEQGYTPCSFCYGSNSGSKSKTYSSRCQATTKAGTQCKRSAESGRNYCWQH